ncbi:hypothetical protein B0H13DRAFT_1870332 [Mycena leptocephala]|nr:hypothetical protein B0H13DRAFT_1870332 [Mycena leptocephala]
MKFLALLLVAATAVVAQSVPTMSSFSTAGCSGLATWSGAPESGICQPTPGAQSLNINACTTCHCGSFTAYTDTNCSAVLTTIPDTAGCFTSYYEPNDDECLHEQVFNMPMHIRHGILGIVPFLAKLRSLLIVVTFLCNSRDQNFQQSRQNSAAAIQKLAYIRDTHTVPACREATVTVTEGPSCRRCRGGSQSRWALSPKKYRDNFEK